MNSKFGEFFVFYNILDKINYFYHHVLVLKFNFYTYLQVEISFFLKLILNFRIQS